jgi:hypothetical protein
MDHWTQRVDRPAAVRLNIKPRILNRRTGPGGWRGRFMVVIENGQIRLGLDQTLGF